MSSCLNGGRAYRLETLDLEFIKSPSTSWASNSSSPSSTISDSSNCPLAISTRKPRTPRKRPNQRYNEAAAILSTAYPKIFPTKNLTKPGKFPKQHDNKIPFLFEPSDLLMPFQVTDISGFLLQPPLLEKPNFPIESKGFFNPFEKPCQSPGEINSKANSSDVCEEYLHLQEDFDAESILDEEIVEGIDSIMADPVVETGLIDDSNFPTTMETSNYCYGYPVGMGFDYGYAYGTRQDVTAMRHVDAGDWWRFPSVNVVDINPKIAKPPVKKKKKKKKKKMVQLKDLEPARETQPIPAPKLNKEDASAIDQTPGEQSAPQPVAKLTLKLNYDDVLNEWSDKGSPFSGDAPGTESAGNDVQVRLAQIDLFSENGGIREASVLRYKEKRRSRLFSKKIRYQVRKLNADRRPRMKGRFVRSPNSPED